MKGTRTASAAAGGRVPGRLAGMHEKTPLPYVLTVVASAVLFVVGVAAMYLDLCFRATGLGVGPYVIWCLSCVAIGVTDGVAWRDWRGKNKIGKRR